MADQNFLDFTQLAVAPADTDAVYIADVSEAVLADQNKYIEMQDLFLYLNGGYAGNIVLEATATLDLSVGTIHVNEAVDLTTTSTELNQLDGVSVGGATAGDIVTIDGTQTLTNKTLTTPTIGDLTNAGHTHADAANGGQLTSPLINEAVALLATATELNQLDSVSVGGTGAGDIATIDGTQTFTNKTLTTPTIGDLTNATHDHSNTAGGGTLNKVVHLSVFDDKTTTIATGDGKIGFVVDANLNGLDLTEVTAGSDSQGSAATYDVMVRRDRSGTPADMLSTAVTLAITEYYAQDGVINTSNDDVQTGDIISIDIDTIQTGGGNLYVTLEFS